MRARLSARGMLRSDALPSIRNGERVTVAGLVLVRQRPGTAKGVIFMTLEDEAGVANVIVWPKAFERLRAIVLGARFVAVTGKLQSESGVIHIVADRMDDRRRCSGPVGCGRDDRHDGARRRSPPAADDVARSARGTVSPRPRASTTAAALGGGARCDVEVKRAMPAGRNFR